MAVKDIIAISQEELKRLHVIRKALDKSITQIEAANIIGLCLRQVQRIVRAVRTEGDKGIINKARGKTSNKALPNKIKCRALKLYKEKYYDFSPTLGSEKLFEIDKIKLNDGRCVFGFYKQVFRIKSARKGLTGNGANENIHSGK